MKSKFFVVCIALICAMCFFVSCDNNTLSVDKVTVSFDSNGGEQIKSIIVEKGKTISLPIPTKENYIFEGWTLDGKPFTKDSIVSSDITLLANWKWDERVWDGKSIDTSWYNSNLSEFTLKYASQLAGLASLVNEGKTFSEKTIYLENDINLNKQQWTSIGRNADSLNKFKGTLDGNNKTISNLLVVDLTEDYHAAGFFGALNGTVRNLNFENVNINSISRGNNGNTDNGTAVVAGSIYTDGSIENISVKNANITGNRYVGGVVGYCYGSVNNCNVENITIDCNPDNLTGKWDNGDKAGSIAGYFVDNEKFSIENNVVKDTTITAYRDFGGVIGVRAKLF